MNVRIETALHKALRDHRESCLRCQADLLAPRFSQRESCPVYLDIARRATEARTIREGRLNVAHSWLSVREAVNF